jgi:hypothetical protein
MLVVMNKKPTINFGGKGFFLFTNFGGKGFFCLQTRDSVLVFFQLTLSQE